MIAPTVHELRNLVSGLVRGNEVNTFIGIPRGGLAVALLCAMEVPRACVYSLGEAIDPTTNRPIWLVDDIAATGETIARAEALLGFKPERTLVLYSRYDSTEERFTYGQLLSEDDGWVTFPWERGEPSGPEDAVRRLIEYLGDDPTRAGLRDTPARVVRFFEEIRGAREAEFEAKVFDAGEAEDLIVTSGIPFGSLCEHHMLPYFGEAAVGYVPRGRVLGLSKAARMVARAAAGLTTQEAVTHAVAQQLAVALDHQDVAVVTSAVHSCMVLRGVKAVGARTSASAMLGAFRNAPELRAEFFSLAKSA